MQGLAVNKYLCLVHSPWVNKELCFALLSFRYTSQRNLVKIVPSILTRAPGLEEVYTFLSGATAPIDSFVRVSVSVSMKTHPILSKNAKM